MSKIKEINDQNDQIQEKSNRASNMIKNLLFIGAALILFAILINNIVVAGTPVVSDGENISTSLSFSSAVSCCARNQSNLSAESIEQEALAYYRATFGEEADAAAVEDFGCHQELVILSSGKPIRRLAYSNGVFSDLGPIVDETGS